MRRLLILLALLVLPSVASAREGWRDWCWNGAKRVTTSGLNSTTTVQATTASCTVTIYVHGGNTLATIYSDNNNTPLANPFTGSNPNGQFIWYADNGRYDQTINVTINGASNTVTMSDVLLCDPYVTGSTCNNGGSTTAHNLLSTTHLDTIPASPPVRGDVITAQNQTSPTGVNPSWARLPLGTAGQVLLSNGLDALWGNLVAGTNVTIVNSGSPSGSTVTINSTGGGSGCTLPGVTDTAVVSEHPVGTCYDGPHWTWDDGTNKQNMLAGRSNTAAADSAGTVSLLFAFGSSNAMFGNASFAWGSNNTMGENTSPNGGHYALGGFNDICDSGLEGVPGCSGISSIGGRNFLTGNSNGVLGSLNQVFEDAPIGSNAMPTSIFVMGNNNTGEFNGTGPNGTFLSQSFQIGISNSMLATHYDSRITETVSIGTSNQISVDGAGSSGGQTTEAINTFLLGEANVVDVTNASIIGTTVVTGVGNQVTADASSDDCFIGILGTSNTVAASASHTANYDTIVGSFNEVDASTTTTGPAVVLGDHETLQNCINCFMFGQNGTLTTSNTMWIGLNAVPGLVITSASSHDNVKRSPLVFASLPACAAGTEGSFAAITDSSTNVWGATITGSSTNHVLGYCDGTNWTVAGK